MKTAQLEKLVANNAAIILTPDQLEALQAKRDSYGNLKGSTIVVSGGRAYGIPAEGIDTMVFKLAI
jgi:hypothetical protein